MSAPCIYITGLCRCCHARGDYKSLGVPYMFQHTEEIYAVLMRETFDILISPALGDNSASTYTICESCIVSLQDAARFKQQVLCCEEKFNKYYDEGLLLDLEVKQEVDHFCEDVKNESFTGYNKESESTDLKVELYEKSKSPQELSIKCFDGASSALPGDSKPKSSVSRRRKKRFKVEDQALDSDPDADWISPPDFIEDETAKEPKPRPKKYSCNICDKTFTYQGSLRSHLTAHADKKLYKCNICQNKFVKSKELVNHIEVTHIEGTTYPCNVCSVNFETAKLLLKHFNKHSRENVKCDECGKCFTRKSGLKDHIMLMHTKEKRFTCEICHRGFVQNQYLKLHMRTHTGEKPFVCDVCGRRFAIKAQLKRHIFVMHSNEKPYSCKVCQKQFSIKHNFDIHERQHTGDSPFTCDICKKPFATCTTLKIHMRIHTGDKPYSCSICGRQFTQTANLKIHERTHTGEKQFSCTVCKKSFTVKGYLKTHMRTHTGEKPYRCDICKQQFSESGSLKRHMSVHTGLKQSCKVCHKKVSDMYKHMKVHSVERAFNCAICNKQFTSSKYLKVHTETHSGAGTLC